MPGIRPVLLTEDREILEGAAEGRLCAWRSLRPVKPVRSGVIISASLIPITLLSLGITLRVMVRVEMPMDTSGSLDG